MDPQIESALKWFRQIYFDGIPVLLQDNKTAFLSFLCVVAATDAVAGYRYSSGSEERFKKFIENYFPPEYAAHASNLYVFRCRMLHNFSPAHFTLVHAQPALHLQQSPSDTHLDDGSLYKHMRDAAERYFVELQGSAQLQADILTRLSNLAKGGAIWVQE
jgi:hypothetical protein